jgi:molybdopterin converting factor small subunit
MARALRIEVTFLDSLQQVAGRQTTWLELPQGASVARALALLRERMPAFAGVDVVANVNGADAGMQRELKAGDGLFLLPPGMAR